MGSEEEEILPSDFPRNVPRSSIVDRKKGDKVQKEKERGKKEESLCQADKPHQEHVGWEISRGEGVVHREHLGVGKLSGLKSLQQRGKRTSRRKGKKV